MTNHELKSKVMSIGNRLATKSQSRKVALVKAWAIVKAGGLELAVRGVTFGSRQIALQRLAAYEPARVRAWLAPEPENPADPTAVAVMVMVQGGCACYRLGYVPREQTAVVKAMGGKLPALHVVSGTSGRGKPTYGARITLAA